MCDGVALAWSELPLEWVERHGLAGRIHERGGEQEVRFLYRDRQPLLPVWHEGQLLLVRWGKGRSPGLPRGGWTRQTTVEGGYWQEWQAQAVEIPASLGRTNGVWYQIKQGVRGLLVADESGELAAYMICEPASHYFQVMTRSKWMPVLLGERI
jgi:hypothetical protein